MIRNEELTFVTLADKGYETWGILYASAYSKFVASLVTYPHEVIRTRFHTESTPPKRYKTIFGTIRLILKEEGGIRAFYAGFGTNLVRTIPASTITLVAYETLSRLLGVFNTSQLQTIDNR